MIDDLLPCERKHRKLLFSKQTPRSEFWVPLLEKAYAKFVDYEYEGGEEYKKGYGMGVEGEKKKEGKEYGKGEGEE